MALVSEDKKFIFIHIFKTGGNSIREALKEYPASDILTAHCSIADLKETMIASGKDKLFKKAFKFAFVRNPFDWMVSTYIYHFHSPEGYWMGMKGMSFRQFLEWYCTYAMVDCQTFGSNRCMTQTQFTLDVEGIGVLDFVGKFENMNDDWKVICDRIGVPCSPLPKVNVSSIRNGRSYREFYDEYSRVTIERVFGEDLKNFGYFF